MLKICYLLAKIGVDTAENEPDVEALRNGLRVLIVLSPVSVAWKENLSFPQITLRDDAIKYSSMREDSEALQRQ